ncbi:MAG TPA: GntR family transcriptional regulator, partial [Opitutales bacterium]|nr:GntR family transcriptional regulator [Opitutales bacterium]
MPFDILSPAAQVAQHLKKLILKGHWQRHLPGTPALSRETGVDRKTITAAMQLLEEQGLLQSQGAGRPRKIVVSGKQRGAGLRVTILIYEERVRQEIYVHKLVSQLQASGHVVSYSKRTLVDMGMKLEKVIQYVKAN